MAQPAPPEFPVPPNVQHAQAQLSAALAKVEGKPVDMLQAPWAELEKAALNLIGGTFQPNRQDHQFLALGLAGAFAERMHLEHQAFWFLNRDSPEGATLGFPDAMIMLSPFGAVMEALIQGQLARMEELAANIRRSLGQARLSPQAPQGQRKLGREEYQRVFDPGFFQFVVLDPSRVTSTVDAKTDVLARDLRDALGRTKLPPEVRQEFDRQIIQFLQRMEPGKSLGEQAERVPRLVELMAHLTATVGGTGSTSEEFWQNVVIPLLYIGAPAQFPPLDEEELEVFRQGAVPLLLFYVDVVPHAHSAPEEGLLGAFDMADISPVHPAFPNVGLVRLFQVNISRMRPLLEKFDPEQSRAAVKRFSNYAAEKAGKPATQAPQSEEMLNAAIMLLTDLKRAVMEAKGQLCLRRLTQADAEFEEVIAEVRHALQGPRIIL